VSIISTILGVETSGGNNITQGNIGDSTTKPAILRKVIFRLPAQRGHSSAASRSDILLHFKRHIQCNYRWRKIYRSHDGDPTPSQR
jgi:hypothetical protein